MNHVEVFLLRGLALLVSASLLALTGSVLAQQGEDQLPPQVIDVTPYPGEEVLTDQPVAVTFDQAMDTASVESAWQSDPAITGQFAWADAKTLTFTPAEGWQRATRYNISIGTGAKAANGLPLVEPYKFFVQTIGYLEVTTVIPAPDAEGVSADATITVSFSRPVVPLVSTEQLADLPQPVVIEPALDGKGEWLNTSVFMFTPAKPLSGGTTYTVSVPAGLKDMLGATLDQTVSWKFKTLAPEILNVYPYQSESGVRLERPVTIEFSQPMDRASTEAAFSLIFGGEPVAGAFSWSEDSRSLTFQPEAKLKIESMYVVTLAPTARGASGESTLEEGLNYLFSTVPYPGISDTTPTNGEQDVYPGSGVSIYFKSPMDTNTFEGKAAIISPEGVEWKPVVYGDDSFYMDFATQPNTTYTIQFNRGALDVYGNAIETDYIFTFKTGEIESSAWMPYIYGLALTNAYRDDTRLAMGVNGKPEVSFRLHRVKAEDMGQALRGYYDDYTEIMRRSDEVRTWEEDLDAGPTLYGVDEVLLASEDGGTLPRGVYLFSAKSPNNSDWQIIPLGVVNANLTVKGVEGEQLVWVTDMQTAEPIAGTTVTFYSEDGRELAVGTTGDDGVYRLSDTPDINSFYYVIAESETVYGVWTTAGAYSLPDDSGYVYTDRPIYRPGETVYFRGVIRDRRDMVFTPPDAASVMVHIDVNWQSQMLLEQEVKLTEFGTFSGELKLPDDVQLGQANISVTYHTSYEWLGSFTIAEFRVPEYKVEVTPDNDTIIQGDPVKAVVAASYYFGGPVSGATLNWNAYGEASWFNYTGPGRYNFVDDSQDYFSWVEVGSGSTQTDSNGRVMVELNNTKAPSTRPMTISLEGQVVDESGQYISGRTSIMAHPAEVYVGLHTDRYFGEENVPLNVDLIAVTPDSIPLAEQKIEITVVETRWERTEIEGQFGQYDWTSKEIEVQTAQVLTGSDGTAQFEFTPPQSGLYMIRALSRDQRERENRSALHLWVTGRIPVWWGRPSNTIDLIADKDSYQPGDTAEVLIPIPFSGVSHVLVTAERAGIQQYEVFRVEGSTLVYKLPITDQHVPTIYITATLMKGMDEESLNPQYRTGSIALSVEPVNQRLQVTITPSATLAQPGDTVALDIKTVDARGEPVSAEVGVVVTDQAILSLMPPNSVSLESHFYGYQGNYVSTDVALRNLLDVMTDEALKDVAQRQATETGGAMPAAAPTQEAALGFAADGMVAGEADASTTAPTVEIRQDFQQTPLWAPHVVTDATGQASVSVTLPDNLTTWHVDARGLTLDTRVGDAGSDVMSTLPLLTRPVVPRFFVVGDRVVLASVINNNTEQAQTVQATLEATGVRFESDAAQTITIDARGRARAEWTVVIEDVPYVDLTFFAVGQDGYQDASKPTLATGPDGTIPVYRYTAPDTVGTGGMLREGGSRTEGISLPPHLDVDQGELVVHLDPSLAVTTVDALTYLKNFKHQCIEQTVSRFLPNVMTYRALKDLGLDDPALKENLLVALNEALARLTNDQNPDGGWGWFGGMESNPYITSYAVLGLAEARGAGFEIDQLMLDRAINFVRQYLVLRPTIDTQVWELNRQAFYRYVLARAGQMSTAELDALLDHRLEMDYWALSFLLMAYHEVDPANTAVAQLVSDLQTGAILSATGGHWEEKEVDWWNWSSDTRSTAIALAALTRVQPDHDLLPNVVRWLMVARKGDHWETTQETAWAIMALTDWMVASGELKGNYTYTLALNGLGLGEGTVTPDTVREGQVLRVQIKDLLRDEINRLTVNRSEGDGALYYTAHLNVRLWASEAKPISRGVSVSREYFLANDPQTPISGAKVGDVITVRVTMTLPQDIYYFVLEDPIPAGTEAIDTSLLTTSQTNAAPSIRPDRDARWWWGWWLFDRNELRDEEVDLYADFLPRGTYTYTYQVRASFPGEYQTMPSHAYAFYFPEVFGRGAGTLFTITE